MGYYLVGSRLGYNFSIEWAEKFWSGELFIIILYSATMVHRSIKLSGPYRGPVFEQKKWEDGSDQAICA